MPRIKISYDSLIHIRMQNAVAVLLMSKQGRHSLCITIIIIDWSLMKLLTNGMESCSALFP